MDLPFSPRVPYADFTLRIDERRWMEDPTRALLHALGGLTLRRLREMRYNMCDARRALATPTAPAALLPHSPGCALGLSVTCRGTSPPRVLGYCTDRRHRASPNF